MAIRESSDYKKLVRSRAHLEMLVVGIETFVATFDSRTQAPEELEVRKVKLSEYEVKFHNIQEQVYSLLNCDEIPDDQKKVSFDFIQDICRLTATINVKLASGRRPSSSQDGQNSNSRQNRRLCKLVNV
jgi:hypothetical protein